MGLPTSVPGLPVLFHGHHSDNLARHALLLASKQCIGVQWAGLADKAVFRCSTIRCLWRDLGRVRIFNQLDQNLQVQRSPLHDRHVLTMLHYTLHPVPSYCGALYRLIVFVPGLRNLPYTCRDFSNCRASLQHKWIALRLKRRCLYDVGTLRWHLRVVILVQWRREV